MTFGNMQISLAGTPIGKVLNVSAVKLWLWGFPSSPENLLPFVVADFLQFSPSDFTFDKV